MKYRARARKLLGWLTIEFAENGLLKRYDNKLKGTLTDAQAEALRVNLPGHIADLPRLTRMGFELQEVLGEGSANEAVGSKEEARVNPVAVWCAGYNANHKATYRVTKAEVGMLNQMADLVTTELVALFMSCQEWWANPKTVAVYFKCINQVRELQVSKEKTPDQAVAAAAKQRRYQLTKRRDELASEGRKHASDAQVFAAIAQEKCDAHYAQLAKHHEGEAVRVRAELDAVLRELERLG